MATLALARPFFEDFAKLEGASVETMAMACVAQAKLIDNMITLEEFFACLENLPG